MLLLSSSFLQEICLTKPQEMGEGVWIGLGVNQLADELSLWERPIPEGAKASACGSRTLESNITGERGNKEVCSAHGRCPAPTSPDLLGV